MFTTIRQGAKIYILEKGDTHTLKIGQVSNVTSPRAKYSIGTPGAGVGMNTDMVVDISATADGQTYDFKELSGSQVIADYGNAVVSESREAMMQEVDAIRLRSQNIIDSKEYNQRIVVSCDEIMKVLNPQFAKEQERDAALVALQTRFDDFEGKVGKALGNIEKLLAKSPKQ